MTRHYPSNAFLRTVIPVLTTYLLFFGVIVLVIIPSYRSSIETKQREQIRNLTVSAWHVLERFANVADMGIMTQEEAQRRAADDIRSLRYGKDLKDYFWINDMQCVMIMHPYRPDLEGISLTNYIDHRGNHIFQNFVNIAKTEGEGYTEYWWQLQNDTTVIVPKISYIMAFDRWGWIIGTGMYVDNVRKEISNITKRVVFLSIFVLFVSAVLLFISVHQSLNTERERADHEANQQRSERKYRELFSLESDALFLVANENGAILETNDAAVKMYGYSHEELMNMQLSDLSLESGLLNESMRNRVTAISSQIHHRKTEVAFPVDITMSHLVQDGREVTIAAIRDITDRKRTEDALVHMEREKGAILNSVTDYVIYHAPDMSILWANQAYLNAIRTVSSDRIINSCHQFMHQSDSYCPDCPVLRTLETGDEIQLEHTMPDGKTWSFISYPVLDDYGAISGIVEIIRNISQQKTLESQLLHSQKMESIGRLAGGIAHDFNNLLTIILGNVDIALLFPDDSTQTTQRIHEIRTAAQRATGLTRQLLAFSRNQPSEPRVISPNDIITDLNKLLRRLIGEDITLRTNLSGEHLSLKIDPAQVEQVLINLVVNARDAMPEGGIMTIETKNVTVDKDFTQHHAEMTPGNYVMLAVTDTGIGMSEEVKAKIFEPFFTTKQQGKGTGLGLSTCYGIVRQNNGFIWVYSEPGFGSTFKIYLPSTNEIVSTESLQLQDESTLSGNETILVVEDEAALKTLIVATLHEYGYEVIEADNGQEAIQYVVNSGKAIDLVISDVIMPRMGGKALAYEIKRIAPYMKILFMSGYTDETIITNGVLENSDAFLQKPFTMRSLIMKVRSILDNKV
jgi:two-component system, cell cycle sensor histidine kinase and response regulator CckA